jgi:hypothetical protein
MLNELCTAVSHFSKKTAAFWQFQCPCMEKIQRMCEYVEDNELCVMWVLWRKGKSFSPLSNICMDHGVVKTCEYVHYHTLTNE